MLRQIVLLNRLLRNVVLLNEVLDAVLGFQIELYGRLKHVVLLHPSSLDFIYLVRLHLFRRLFIIGMVVDRHVPSLA